jgi:hypothetical protein
MKNCDRCHKTFVRHHVRSRKATYSLFSAGLAEGWRSIGLHHAFFRIPLAQIVGERLRSRSDPSFHDNHSHGIRFQAYRAQSTCLESGKELVVPVRADAAQKLRGSFTVSPGDL